MIKKLYILIFCLVFSNIHGQSLSDLVKEAIIALENKEPDKGIELLENATKEYIKKNDPDENSILALSQLSRLYTNKWDFKKAEYYAVKGVSQSQEIGNDSLYFNVVDIALSLLDYHNKIDSSILLSRQVIAKENAPAALVANSHIILAGFHDENEVNDSAIYHIEKAVYLEDLRGDSVTLPYAFFDYANFLLNDNQYELALEKMLYGMSYLRKEDEQKRISFNIGLSDVYFKIGNIKKSEELAIEALKYAKENKSYRMLIDSYIQLGAIESHYNNWSSALNYYEKADSINTAKNKLEFKGITAKIGAALAKIKLGNSLSNDEIKSLKALRSSVSSDKLRNNLDFLFLRIDDYTVKEFEDKYNELFDQSEAKNADHLLFPLLELKKDFYTKKGDFKKALLIDDQMSELSKNLTQANNEYIIQELDAKYQKEIQDKEISYLNTQNESKSKVVKQQRRTIIVGALALIFVSILLTMLFRLLKKVNKQKDIISKALSDKDILIKEIHHRVKNNLQLISSLLTLQGRGIDDKKAKSAIQDGKNRVRSMALIHQDLYMKDKLKDINLKSYLEKLTTDLFLTYKIDHSSIELKLDIDDIDLDVDTIVPLGLIINELITNSLKYAFPDNNKGILKVSLKEKYETLELEIVDNGVGFEAENVRNDSFGTTLISALTRQLRGKLTTDSSNGTKTILTIPNETKNQ